MSKNKFSKHYFCVCDQSYANKHLLRQHIHVCKHAQNQSNQCVIYPMKKDLLQLAISNCEIQSVNNKLKVIQNQSIERFKCGCEKRFQSKGGYYRHIKKCKLRPEQKIVSGKTKCNEPGCLLTFKYIRDFRQHLNKQHKIQFDVEDKHFNRYSDFLQWKENYETETRSCFYHRKTETRSGRRVEYWYCNRSGIYQSASQDRRRKLKSQGILKINNNCTSSITVTINKNEGTVQTVIHHTHYGHEAELVHLRIPNSDKQEIASKLLQGVKIEDILLSYKEDGLFKKIERKHLIKRRDILNISKKYNVNIILPKERQHSKKKKNSERVQEMEKSFLNENSSQEIESKKRHIVASQLSLSFVNQIHDNVWKVSMENDSVSTQSLNIYEEDVYVTKNDITCCVDECKAYCNCCNICYHAYSCTCSDFLAKTIICEHIHLVVLFQVTPQTFQYEESIKNPIYNNYDHTNYTQKCTKSTSPIQYVENGHLNENDLSEDVVYSNDIESNIKLDNLKNIKMRLEKLMSETLEKVSKCNNCDLLEHIEKQIINITCNLNTDLLQDNKRSNETQIVPEKNIEVYYVF